MANILDYIDWRGDIPFARDPINAVDLLIFSIISYADMDDLFKGDRILALPHLAERYIQAGIDQSALAYDPKPVLTKVSESVRFGNVLVGCYVNRLDKETDTQFSAVTFQISRDTNIVAFRGTDNTITGWREDFNASYQKTHAQDLAMRYLNQITDENIYVCGHSKGGNLAIYSASFCNTDVQDHIVTAVSFDGPGYMDETVNAPGYKKILSRTILYLPESSVIGLLMNQYSERIIIESTETLMMQHDPYSWKVMGCEFVKAKQLSAFSQYIEEIMDGWIKDTTVEEKKQLVNTLFTALEAGGAETFQQLSSSKKDTIASILKFLRESNTKDIKAVGDTLMKLAGNTGNMILSDVKNYVNQKLSPDNTDKENTDKESEEK